MECQQLRGSEIVARPLDRSRMGLREDLHVRTTTSIHQVDKNKDRIEHERERKVHKSYQTAQGTKKKRILIVTAGSPQ